MTCRVCRLCDIAPEELERIKALLDPNRLEAILRKPKKKAEQSLAVRALLARLLADEFGLTEGFLPDARPDGKPYLPAHPWLYISLSHSGDTVACCASDHPVGIDVEQIRPISDRVIHRVCTAEERKYVSGGEPDRFFAVWTLKEACFKASDQAFSDILAHSFVKDGAFPRFARPTVRYYTEKSYGCYLTAVELL